MRCLVLAIFLSGPAAAVGADRQPPVWPEGAALLAGADAVLHDRPPRGEEAWLGGHVHLEWPAASDDTRVTRYRVFRDGRRVADVGGDVHAWDRREKRARGTWSVRAGDAAGNWSTPLRADVRSPMEDAFGGPGMAALGLAKERPITRDVRIRIGRRGGAAFFEKRLAYGGDAPVELAAPDAGLVLRLAPSGDKWRLTVSRKAGGEALSVLIATDPLDPARGGSCELDGDFEHNGGLWIELGIAGAEASPAQACAQLAGPR